VTFALRPKADDSLVLSTLRPLVKTAPTRTCYRLIGGILTERTVQDVVPTLETKEVLESLMKTYKGKETEFSDFQKEYGIQVRSPSESSAAFQLTVDARSTKIAPGDDASCT